MFLLLQVLTAGFIGHLTLLTTAAADPPDIASRKDAWREVLDRREFAFPDHCSELLISVGRCKSNCTIHVISDSKNRWEFEIKFVRDGQEVLSLRGDGYSSFTSFSNTLFFAKFSVDSTGCAVLAYDLTTGKNLWQTDLHHAKPTNDAAYLEDSYDGRYSNRVTIRMSRPGEIKDGIARAALVITGKESYCDYVEVLDSQTGESLAVKNYRVLLVREPENQAFRQNAWREVLDRREYYFPKLENFNGVRDSLRRFNADCKIHIVYDPKKKWTREFRFVRNRSEVLSLRGHVNSVFTSFENTLYFAKYPPVSMGCTVLAYDLASGEKLWQTDLYHAKGGHSAYANFVTIRMSNAGEIKDGIAGAAIIVTGKESYCDYVEVLDAKTGVSLASKNYRTMKTKGTGSGTPRGAGGGSEADQVDQKDQKNQEK